MLSYLPCTFLITCPLYTLLEVSEFSLIILTYAGLLDIFFPTHPVQPAKQCGYLALIILIAQKEQQRSAITAQQKGFGPDVIPAEVMKVLFEWLRVNHLDTIPAYPKECFIPLRKLHDCTHPQVYRRSWGLFIVPSFSCWTQQAKSQEGYFGAIVAAGYLSPQQHDFRKGLDHRCNSRGS